MNNKRWVMSENGEYAGYADQLFLSPTEDTNKFAVCGAVGANWFKLTSTPLTAEQAKNLIHSILTERVESAFYVSVKTILENGGVYKNVEAIKDSSKETKRLVRKK